MSTILWGAIFIAPLTHARTALEDCALINDDIERLACFDQWIVQQQSMSDSKSSSSESTKPSKPYKSSKAAVQASREPERQSSIPANQEANFGSKAKRVAEKKAKRSTDSISARIERVTKTSLGHHVMALSNGQVWMENEPGQRRIQPDQNVVVSKQRWHYEMELPNQPNVAVRRVE